MPENAENYRPINTNSPFRRQAVRVWAWTTAVTGIWLAAIIAPPLLEMAGLEAFAAPVFSFFGYACHQIPERSFHIDGHQLAVCSRCFGVYAGLLAGVLAYPLWRRVDEIEPLPRVWLFASMVPIAIDWSLTIFGIWENTHLTRTVTGAILGFACATYILPALVEIRRFISRPRPV